MLTEFRKAKPSDFDEIWEILSDAIQRRKNEGSNQWQDGYPNQNVLQKDIEKGNGYVLVLDQIIIGYIVILINDEPVYKDIVGSWLTNGDFVVFHRVAISNKYLNKGFASNIFQLVEKFAKEHNISSIKADTNFDNKPMLSLFDKFGYKYCGEVYFRGSPRRAYEKILF